MDRRKTKHCFTLCHHTFENLFLIPLPQALPYPNYHQDTTIYTNFYHSTLKSLSFHETRYVETPSLLFSYQFPKIYLPFQNKKSLMKPDRFDFISLPSILPKLYPHHYHIISSHMLLNRKTQKTVSV